MEKLKNKKTILFSSLLVLSGCSSMSSSDWSHLTEHVESRGEQAGEYLYDSTKETWDTYGL